MIPFYVSNHLDWDIQYDEKKKCVIIDNYYENPEDVYEFVQKRDVPLWKYNEERQSPNGIDYLDCRIVDKIGHPTRGWINSIERLANVAREYYIKVYMNGETTLRLIALKLSMFLIINYNTILTSMVILMTLTTVR